MNHLLCPRLDSNQHVLANTTPSRWRVYQFHHVGIKKRTYALMACLPILLRRIDFTTWALKKNVCSAGVSILPLVLDSCRRLNIMSKKKPPSRGRFFSDPAGIRTQDPYIKSVLLYQLSYGIRRFFKSVCKYRNLFFCYKQQDKKVKVQWLNLG